MLASSFLASCSLPSSGLSPELGSPRDMGAGDAGGDDSGVDTNPPPDTVLEVQVLGSLRRDDGLQVSYPVARAIVQVESEAETWTGRTDSMGIVSFDRAEKQARTARVFVFAEGFTPYAAFGVQGERWTAHLTPKFMELERPVEPPSVFIGGDASEALAALGSPSSFREMSLHPFALQTGEPGYFVQRFRREGVQALPASEGLGFKDTAFDAPAFGLSDPRWEARVVPGSPLALAVWGNDRSNDADSPDPGPDAVSWTMADPPVQIRLPWTKVDRVVRVDLRPLAASRSVDLWMIRKLWAPEQGVLVPAGEMSAVGPTEALPDRVELRFPSAASSDGVALEVSVALDQRPMGWVSQSYRIPIDPGAARETAFQAVLSTSLPSARVEGRRLFLSLDPEAHIHKVELEDASLEGDGRSWTVIVTAVGVAESFRLPPSPDGEAEEEPLQFASVRVVSRRWPGSEAEPQLGWDEPRVHDEMEQVSFYSSMPGP